jgi:hypothetical protein
MLFSLPFGEADLQLKAGFSSDNSFDKLKKNKAQMQGKWALEFPVVVATMLFEGDPGEVGSRISGSYGDHAF